MRAWVLLIIRTSKCCKAFPTMALEGYPKVRKILLISWIDFWVILKSGNGIRNCVVYPFNVYNFGGILL
jgi:hypothetical protein